jgi:hypothetical protein
MPRSRIERRALIGVLLVAAVVLALGATAFAAGGTTPTPSKTPTLTVQVTTGTAAPSRPATSGSVPTTVAPPAKGGYALDFTLPTFGKSGCLVCHGDPNLVGAKGDSTHSYWIDEETYNKSAHATVICTGCHVDYGYKAPHGQAGADWRAVAKQACKNCHQSQLDDVSVGSHAIKPSSGAPDPKAASKPLCGDCHGGHDIMITKNDPAAKARLHAQSQRMCGRDGCHADYWDNYRDYYHGAAYKAGASDAPACWECHGTHTTLKSTERYAPTNRDNLGEQNSCGQPGCHIDASGLSSYVPLIHSRAKAVESNPLYSQLSRVFGGLKK